MPAAWRLAAGAVSRAELAPAGGDCARQGDASVDMYIYVYNIYIYIYIRYYIII
jgi:hypothetical protein